ncbi:MAG TPA: bifunctional polysaccharide deacetylase/glycosyltransferase family 2 protein [Acidimicrobiales bacterium]|nr:bifunctional polysaccharide deacetylase/glycosyltransferase family 2 protein [Acidimicrobiales bacterium]
MTAVEPSTPAVGRAIAPGAPGAGGGGAQRRRLRELLRRPPTHWVVLVVLLVVLVLMLATAGMLRSSAPRQALGRPALPSPATTGPVIDLSGPTLRSGHGDGSSVGLALVGLPSSRTTVGIAQELAAHGATATWFVDGRDVLRHPEAFSAVTSVGDEVGVTGFGGTDLRGLSPWRARFDLSVAQASLAARGRVTSPLLLLPTASRRADLDVHALRAARIAAGRGYVLVAGTTAGDAAPGDVAVIDARDPGAAGEVQRFLDTKRTAGVPVRAVGTVVGLTRDEVNRHAGAATVVNATVIVAAVAASELVADSLPILFVGVTALVALRALLALGFALFHRVRRQTVRGAWTGPVSVIVPAYNEAVGIEATVRSLASSEWPHGLEIVVVDDGSTDGTADLVDALELPGVVVVRQVNSGKPSAINAGVAAAAHDIVVLVDGDTVFQPDTVARLVAPLADDRVGATSGNAKVANRSTLLGRWQHIEYVMGFNLDRRLLDVVHAIPTVPGAVGAFRRETLDAVGGVSDDTIAEDTDLTIAISRAGWRVVYVPGAIAWTEAPSSVGDLWRQRYRWCYGTLQAAWKHRRALVERRSIGLVGVPYALLFQVVVALVAPIVDVAALYSLATGNLGIVTAWAAFTALQTAMAAYAFALDGESLRPLWAVPLQQLFYRQLMYLVVIQSVASAAVGARLRWHKLHRLGVSLERVPAD